MFTNCPFCKALVATDPATDLPPEHCPRCAAKLRGIETSVAAAAMSTAPQGGDLATAPRLDPTFLLQPPLPEASLPEGRDGTALSKLSSRIHRIVALETSAHASPPPPGIAPIATMLKRTDDEPASPSQPDTAARSAGTAASTPEPASVTGSAPAAPPAAVAARVAKDSDADVRKMDAATGATAIADAARTPTQGATGPDTTRRDAAADTTAAPAPLVSDPSAAAAATAAPTAAAATPAMQPATRSLPSFAHRRGRLGASGFHWKTGAAIAALALLLVLQLLLADRARLSAQARWRPLLSNVCSVLGCALPPWREPAAFTVLAREVRPHPSTPGALRVTATFRNDARWPQPWPQVQLTLSDVNGNPVAARDFSARDYLDAGPAQAELGSGQSASIAFDIVEPESRSVAFDFNLH